MNNSPRDGGTHVPNSNPQQDSGVTVAILPPEFSWQT